MACEYTYKGTKYTEKEFKAILAENILGQEASIDNIVSLFTPPTPTISSTRKEAEKEMKGKSDVEVIQVQLDDLLDLLSPPSPQITKTYPFTNIKGSLGKIAKALSKVAPNLTINIVGDKEYVRRAVEAGMTENEAKRSSAFYDALTDSIVINRLMGVHNTLTHETAHPVVAAALNSNPDLATAFAQKLRSIQTPQGITYGEWVDRNYLSPYTEAEKAIEVVCEFLSNVAIGKHKDLVGQTIWDDFVDFINSILSSLGIELTAPLSTDDDVMAFAKGFGRALKTGAVIRMEKANNELYDKPQPQNRETAIVKAVNDKMASLIEAGHSVESIKEAFADAKYEPIRKAIENHYGFDFDVYVDGFYDDFNTNSPKEIISTGSFSSSVTPETRKQKVKSFVRSIKSGDISDSDKKRLDTEVGMFYDELPHEELERIGNSIIEELGGLANAVNEAMKVNTTLPPYIRVFVLGQAIIAKRRAEKAAKGEAKNKLADEQNELSVVIEQTLVELTNYIDVMVRDMGRAINRIGQFYATSGLAIIRRAQKEMNERNEAMGKTISTEDVKEFKSAFEDKAESNESALEAVFDGNAMAKTIEQQQAEIDRLQKELDKKLKTKTGTTISVSRPAKKKVDFGITKEDVEKARKEVLKYLSANPFANPEMYKAVVTVAGYGIQQGIRSFQDFYAYMNKQLNGKHKETYEDIYKALRSKGAENNVTDFDNDSDIAKAIEEIEALEAEIADKKRKQEILKKVMRFGLFLSERLTVEKDNKTRKEKIFELADSLDELLGTDAYNKSANEYFNIADEEAKANKLERDIARFEKALEEKENKPKVDTRTREQKLRDEAARLDAEKGTTEFTEMVDDYFRTKQEQAEERRLLSDINKLEKQLEAKQPTNRTTVSREERLRQAASELDAKIGGNTYTDAVERYLASEDKKNKIKAFGRLLSQPVSQATNRKSKEQNLRERAAELDALYNTDSFSKQAEAYIDGKRQDKLTTPQKVADSIKTALIELGYAKEVNGKKVVDWSGVVKGVKDPKKVWEKIDNVLKDVLSPSDYAIQSPMLRDAFFAEVNDRRAKSVIAEMKKFERKRNPLNRVRRKSRAEHLMELYNTGALDNDTIRQELLDVLGAKQIKDEDWKKLEALMDAIDIAPMGAEKEKLEEELYFRLDELKAGHLLRVYFERMRGRMLAGMITFVKNAMGVTTTTTMLWYKRFINQLSAIKGDRDAHVAQVINNARKMAWINTMDVAWNGGIDMGSAFSETTGTKEGTPRVRYIEYDAIKPILVNLGFTQLEITKASNVIRAIERIPSRGLSAMDTLNAAKLQDVEMYTFIKTKIRAYDPALSNKEAGRKAYEIMYSIPVEQAIAEAYAEFAKRGIEITDSKADQFRLRRRAYEMIQQKREADAVKAGQYYANRYTFKAHDAGAASVLFLALMGAKQILPLTTNKFVVAHLNKLGKKKAAQNTKEFVEATNEFLFITILPFIKGVTLILEKRLELNTPYGIAKGIAYTVPAILEKDPLKKKVAYQRAGEYYWRAAIGTLASIMIYALADDDEEGEKLIGAGGTKDWKDNAVESTLKTQNSVTMFGHKIPAQAFGTLDLNIMAMGMYQDYLREQKRLYGKDFNENEEEFSLAARIASTILEDEYLRSAQSLYRGLTDDNGVRQSGYWNRTFAEWFTRSLIPATGFIRQGADALTSEAKKPVGIMENIWKQSGLFSSLVSRKAFDYRGRTYDSGDVYGNGTRAFTTILSKEAAADPIDKFVYRYNPNVSTPSVLNQEYQVRAMDGTERPMTEEEYYDFSYSKSTKFGKLIEAYYKTNPQDQVVAFNMPAVDSDKYYALERDAIAELKQEGKTVNLATDAGFAEMTNKMYEIGEREAVREKISKDISKMNTLASKAAFAEIIAATDSYYVLDYSTALEEYEELLEALTKQ